MALECVECSSDSLCILPLHPTRAAFRGSKASVLVLAVPLIRPRPLVPLKQRAVAASAAFTRHYFTHHCLYRAVEFHGVKVHAHMRPLVAAYIGLVSLRFIASNFVAWAVASRSVIGPASHDQPMPAPRS